MALQQITLATLNRYANIKNITLNNLTYRQLEKLLMASSEDVCQKLLEIETHNLNRAYARMRINSRLNRLRNQRLRNEVGAKKRVY